MKHLAVGNHFRISLITKKTDSVETAEAQVVRKSKLLNKVMVANGYMVQRVANLRGLHNFFGTQRLTPKQAEEMLAKGTEIFDLMRSYAAGMPGKTAMFIGENNQRTTRYEIALWKKLAYPFAALVMMGLALPFGYMQTRMGGVSLKVFSGIMIGVGFHLLNGLFSNLGVINGWIPAVAALTPSIVFLIAAMGMMWWVERR